MFAANQYHSSLLQNYRNVASNCFPIEIAAHLCMMKLKKVFGGLLQEVKIARRDIQHDRSIVFYSSILLLLKWEESAPGPKSILLMYNRDTIEDTVLTSTYETYKFPIVEAFDEEAQEAIYYQGDEVYVHRSLDKLIENIERSMRMTPLYPPVYRPVYTSRYM